MKLVFAIPGEAATRTGGYIYDRKIMALLPEFGIDTVLCQLPPTFPFPDAPDLDRSIDLINQLCPADAVLIDGLAYGAFPEAAIAAINAPIIALCHHPLGLEAGLDPARRQALLASEAKALKLAARIIVTSSHTAGALSRDFGVPASRISVALPGVEPAPRARGTRGPAVALLAVGSLTPRKAFHILIEALAGLKALNWRLAIAGGTHYAPETAREIMRLIEHHGLGTRIACLGELEGDELERLFDKSDVFVSSSLYEGYGMALAEAMVRGLPIVAAAGGAVADTVAGDAALLVPPGDVAALRAALKTVIADRYLRCGLAGASRAAGQRLPSWKDSAALISRVVMEMANEGTTFAV